MQICSIKILKDKTCSHHFFPLHMQYNNIIKIPSHKTKLQALKDNFNKENVVL